MAQNQYDWKFVFLAANQDAFATAANYGMKSDFAQTYDYSRKGTSEAYSYASGAVKSIRGW